MTEHGPIHVFDLPQLYTRPSASSLLQTLVNLAIKPLSWAAETEDDDKEPHHTTFISEDGIPKYLTSIVSSQLSWIEDVQLRETIWEDASSRLSERSGRTAQPTLSRTFTIPLLPPSEAPLHITLIEPSLTADNLGHKTWLASYLLARRLPSLFTTHLAHHTPLRLLELGSGTGLLGITAAALLPSAQARLTDLNEIVGNLEKNVHANADLFNPEHPPTVDILDWSVPLHKPDPERYDIILASDPLYSPLHPEWLVRTIYEQLSTASTARVMIELPLRDAYLGEVGEMRKRMLERGLVLVDSGEESGSEDWGGRDGAAGTEVRCWWGVWGWA